MNVNYSTAPSSGEITNYFRLSIPALPSNEGFSRVCAAAFASQLDMTLEELSDIKTAVSEAVTNAVVHAYPHSMGEITIEAWLSGSRLTVSVTDAGVGIPDVAKAREPFYTTGGEERSGMGFTVMETLMDSVAVRSTPGHGVSVTMEKTLA